MPLKKHTNEMQKRWKKEKGNCKEFSTEASDGSKMRVDSEPVLYISSQFGQCWPDISDPLTLLGECKVLSAHPFG